MIIYAPIIADTIPAFGGTDIIIPYTHNSAVSEEEITDFSLKIKDMVTSETVLQFDQGGDQGSPGKVKFTLVDLSDHLTPGQYYKFQLAYNYDGGTGPYSSVSIGRYIGNKPTIDLVNTGLDYTGSYGQTPNIIEALYRYRYELYNNNELIKTSGWILYDGSEKLKSFNVLNGNELKFSIVTANGYEEELEENITIPKESNDVDVVVISTSTDNNENGYAFFQLKELGSVYSSAYLVRKKIIGKDNKWEIIDNNFPIKGKALFPYQDFTIELCQQYNYGALATTKGTEENPPQVKILFNKNTIVQCNSEHIFLSDSERQLCIRFNPKVGNFKSSVAEQKVDTLGSSYPFFFKNPLKNGKEFTISGLISYHMDNGQYFYKLPENTLNEERPLEEKDETKATEENNTIILDGYGTTNLTPDNFAIEKIFKLEVLEWLNNGKPKLFRSPAEGNYIVRLTNVSLTPNEQLGNMIHTFSAQAYECMEMTQENLIKNNLVFTGGV